MLRTPLIRTSCSPGGLTNVKCNSSATATKLKLDLHRRFSVHPEKLSPIVTKCQRQVQVIASTGTGSGRQTRTQTQKQGGSGTTAGMTPLGQANFRSGSNQRLKPVILATSTSTYATSSDNTEDPDEGGESYAAPVSVENIYEAESEFGTDSDDHLRINVYPGESDPLVSKLFNATTLQEIFDTVTAIPEGTRNEKHTSQALVSVCNLQKYLYRICIGMEPEKDSENKTLFIQKVVEHPVFKEIVDHLVKNCEKLEDEPLAAALLSLKRLDYKMTSPECQEMLMECRRRKATLALPALSRLTVCVRGADSCNLIMYDFLPVLLGYVETMDSDLSTRLVSISLRNFRQTAPQRVSLAYRHRIAEVLQDKNITFEPVTSCKVLLCLLESVLSEEMEPESKDGCPSPMDLIREVGTRLSRQVSELDVLDIIILQRYIEFGPKEPRALLDALAARTTQLVNDQEDTPVIELLQSMVPTAKSAASRSQLSLFVRDHLDLIKNFESVSSMLAKIMRNTKLNDGDLFNQYWKRAEEMLRRQMTAPGKVIRVTQDYLGFVRANNYTYRNPSFELAAKQILHSYIRNYQAQSQPCLIHPTSIAKAYAFIIAFGSPYEPIFCETDEDSLLAILDNLFANSFEVADWMTIGRGIEASMNLQISSSVNRNQDRRRYSRRYLEQVLNFVAILDERVAKKLLGPSSMPLNPTELHLISKTQLSVKKGSSDSPIFQEAMKQLASCAQIRPELFNSRLYKNIVISLLATTYNVPELLHQMKKYIATNAETVSPDFVTKFVYVAYSLGYQPLDKNGALDLHFFQTCYQLINKYWTSFYVLELLQAMQALCFYHALDSELVHNVFSIDFLNQVDEELAKPSINAGLALRLRIAFMQLNRAVCMELPECQVPWFHEKFCQDLRTSDSASPSSATHVHQEVHTTLSEVLSNPDFIQRDVVTPYSHTIDFLIEFDEKGRPIKKVPRKRSLFSFAKTDSSSMSKSRSVFSKPQPPVVAERVAVLVMNDRSYTKNVRQLRGFSRLQIRHLEMLGHRVIVVDPQQWNSMYMSEQGVRNDFLEQCIYTRERASNS